MDNPIVTIPTEVLLRCCKFVAANHKTRHNLHAIHIDDGRVIATNGDAMVVYTVPELKSYTFTMSLPLPQLKDIVRTLKGYKHPTISYNTETRTLDLLNTQIQLESYNNCYPDYRVVTPHIGKIGGAIRSIGIDPAQLSLFGNSVIHFTGTSDGIMVLEPYSPGDYLWYGLLMPMNINERKFTSHLIQQLPVKVINQEAVHAN